MSLDFNNLQRYMTRRILFALLLLAVGCRAQAPAPSDVNRRVERQVRSALQAPPYVKIEVKDRQPSKNFAGYDDLTVMLSANEHSQPVHFLISKDNQTMYSMTKMDLSKDPYQAVMEKIDVAGRPVRGNKDAKVDGKNVEMEVTPFIDHGRTIVPLSFIQETLNLNIEFDPATGHVLITPIK